MQGRWIAGWAACAAMAAGGIAALAAGRSPSAPSLAAPPAATASPRTEVPVPAAGAIPRTAPTRVIIPAIGVNATIIPEGTDATGALKMPPLNARNVAAWWAGGSAPGQGGPAVIAGHVDNATAPLVFWRLRQLAPGDTVETEPGNLRFEVTRVTQVDKTQFPTRDVYGATKDPELRVITCGGTFDTATGHYLSNVIVYAKEI